MLGFLKNGYFGWDNVKKVLTEFYKTFSNDKTFLSSKRIERAVLLTSGLGLTIVFVYYNRAKLGATDFLIVVSPLFGYAGFNTFMHQKEKKDENNPSVNTDTPIT